MSSTPQIKIVYIYINIIKNMKLKYCTIHGDLLSQHHSTRSTSYKEWEYGPTASGVTIPKNRNYNIQPQINVSI